MRRFALALLIPFAMVAPLAAQGFEGTVSLKMDSVDPSNPAPMVMKWLMKGGNSATSFTTSAMAAMGGGGPTEVRMISDGDAKKTSILIPMTSMPQQAAAFLGDAKGLMIVMDNSPGAPPAPGQTPPAPVTTRKLGTTQTIAGMKCDDVEVTEQGKKEVTMMCVSHEMAGFVFPQANMSFGGRRGGGGVGAPGWSRALKDSPGFPLKVWTADGKVSFEVTAIEKGIIPDSTFAIPDGYRDLNDMMRGLRGGRGGGF